MLIIDSNIWAYYFDRDAPEHKFVVDMVEKALTTGQIATNTVIIVEVTHFLIKNLGALTGMEKVDVFLSFPFTVVDLTYNLTLKAIEYLARYFHLGIGGRDATILATMEMLGLNRIMTHDKAFKKVDWLKVMDPIPDRI
ncbi:MAG: type II toxin-antitoxin system VapC family toxin [Candidatus Bathyarchaeia archaeon]